MMNRISLKTWGIGSSLAIAWALGACSSEPSGGSTTATGGMAAGAQPGVGGVGFGTGGTTLPGTGGLSVGAGGTVSITGGATATTTGGAAATTTGGTAATTTGGTTGSTTGGTAGSTGGSTGTTTTPITGFNVAEGGYITFCGMKGYSWSASGPEAPKNDTGSLSSIAPADFAELAAGTSLCASGVVAEDSDYAGYAMVGINLGQESGDETPNVNVTPTGTGLVVNVTNNTTSKLRVQIQDDLGADDAAHRWCANVPEGGSGTIPWTQFNTECWEPLEAGYYAMQPINAVMIIVPGSNNKDTSFDFCLNGFTVEGVDCPVEVAAQGGATGAGGTTGDTGGAGGAELGGTGEPGGAGGVAEQGGAPGTAGEMPGTGGDVPGTGGDMPGTGGA